MQLLHAVTVASRLGLDPGLDQRKNTPTSSTTTSTTTSTPTSSTSTSTTTTTSNSTAVNLNHPSNAWPRDWKYAYITRHLLRIFIAKLPSGSANEWVVAMIGCIMGYWHQLTNTPRIIELKLGTGNKDTANKDNESKLSLALHTPTVYAPAVYFQEHYFTSIYHERRAVSWQSIEGGWVSTYPLLTYP